MASAPSPPSDCGRDAGSGLRVLRAAAPWRNALLLAAAAPDSGHDAGDGAYDAFGEFGLRVRQFYAHYCPDKIPRVPALLASWADDPQGLWSTMVDTYGSWPPAKDAAETPPAPPAGAAMRETLAAVSGHADHAAGMFGGVARQSFSLFSRAAAAVAQHTKTVAQEIVDEFRDEAENFGRPPPSPRRGLPQTLLDFADGLAEHPDTFINFPLKGGDFVVTDEMEYHARAVLRGSEALSQLRYEICPRKVSDEDFWEVYFTLVNNRGLAAAAAAAPAAADVYATAPSPSPPRPLQGPCCYAKPVAVAAPVRFGSSGGDDGDEAELDELAAAAQLQADQPLRQWQCAFCTYTNATAKGSCTMCGEPRGASLPPPLQAAARSRSPARGAPAPPPAVATPPPRHRDAAEAASAESTPFRPEEANDSYF